MIHWPSMVWSPACSLMVSPKFSWPPHRLSIFLETAIQRKEPAFNLSRLILLLDAVMKGSESHCDNSGLYMVRVSSLNDSYDTNAGKSCVTPPGSDEKKPIVKRNTHIVKIITPNFFI